MNTTCFRFGYTFTFLLDLNYVFVMIVRVKIGNNTGFICFKKRERCDKCHILFDKKLKIN